MRRPAPDPGGGPAAGRRPRPLAALAFVLVVAALVAEALAPFRPDVPGYRGNGARRVPSGLSFDGPSRASTPAPPAWLSAARDGASFDVRLTARSRAPAGDAVRRLLAVSRDYRVADLVVGEQGDDLVVRLRRRGSDPSGEPPARVPGVFAGDRPRRIVIRREGGTVEIEVDGAVRARLDLGPDGLASWRTDLRLALGDEHLGGRAWRGVLEEATVRMGDRRWDYLAGGLDVPPRFWYVPDRLRGWARPGSAGDLVVALGHGLTFVPVGGLGVLAGRGARRRAAGFAVALSLALELGKALVAGRHPSLADFVLQALGGWAGAAAAGWWVARRSPAAVPATSR